MRAEGARYTNINVHPLMNLSIIMMHATSMQMRRNIGSYILCSKRANTEHWQMPM